MADADLPKFDYVCNHDTENFSITPCSVYEKGKMVVLATGLKTTGQIESDKLDNELQAALEKSKNEAISGRNGITAELLQITQRFTRSSVDCVKENIDKLDRDSQQPLFQALFRAFQTLPYVKDVESVLSNLQRSTDKEVGEWKKKHTEKTAEQVRQLEALETTFSEKLAHFQTTSNAYTVMISFEHTDGPVTIKKQHLRDLAYQFRCIYGLILIGIDDRLLFIFEAPVKQKREIWKKYDEITKKVQELFEDNKVRNPRKREGSNLGVGTRKLALLIGKESDIQVSGDNIAYSGCNSVFNKLTEVREFKNEFIRSSDKVAASYTLFTSSKTQTCTVVHICPDCGHECPHNHTCFENNARKVVSGPKNYTAQCDICGEKYQHTHECPASTCRLM